MTPTRILPDLQFSIVCEDVRREMNGMFTAVGVLSVIPVPQLPVTVFKMFVVNRWTCGVGQFTETVRLVGPDGQTVLRKNDIRFALQDPAHSATNVAFLGQLQLSAVGVYHVEVLVDDVMKLRYPLPIVMLPPPQGSEPASAAPRTETSGQPQAGGASGTAG
jgi:hypothetical protein